MILCPERFRLRLEPLRVTKKDKDKDKDMIVWISGWPHSGSALCRMLIEDTLQICTYSKYHEPELGFLFGKKCEDFAECWSMKYWQCCASEKNELYLIKTHEAPLDKNPCIFLLRDGRNAMAGLSKFWSAPVYKTITAEDSPFMDWTTHYRVWHPHTRPYTLIVHFEDMIKQPEIEAARIAEFLSVPVKKKFENPQEECRKHWPLLFKPRHSDHKLDFEDYDTDLFWLLHEETMIAAGYGSRKDNESGMKDRPRS